MSCRWVTRGFRRLPPAARHRRATSRRVRRRGLDTAVANVSRLAGFDGRELAAMRIAGRVPGMLGDLSYICIGRILRPYGPIHRIQARSYGCRRGAGARRGYCVAAIARLGQGRAGCASARWNPRLTRYCSWGRRRRRSAAEATALVLPMLAAAAAVRVRPILPRSGKSVTGYVVRPWHTAAAGKLSSAASVPPRRSKARPVRTRAASHTTATAYSCPLDTGPDFLVRATFSPIAHL